MSWKDCAAAVREAAGRDLTDDQVMDIFERADLRRRALEAEGKLDGLDERLRQAVAEDADALRIEAALARKHAALSVIARDRTMRQIERHLASGLSYRNATLAIFEGTTRGVEGGRHSIAATRHAYEGRFVGEMMAQIVREVPHAEGMLRDRGFLDDVVREMFEGREGGQPGITRNADAQKVARIFADHADRSRQELNRLGANIGKLDGWAGTQVHDGDKIARAGRDAWIDAVLPKLDLARTFPDLATEADVRKVLGRVWENIAFERERGAVRRAEDTTFRNPPNLARALERHRVLHFKTADDWLSYSQAFGTGHIFDGMVQHQSRAALNASAMEALGPNPGATFGNLLDTLKRRIDSDDSIPPERKVNEKQKLAEEGTAVAMAYNVATGLTMIPVSRSWAEISGTVRAVESLAKLGGALISSITDLPTAIVNLRFNGMSFGEAIGGQVSEFLRGRGAGEQRELAYLLGEGFDGMIGHIASPYVAGDGAPGAVERATTFFFRWTGLTWWTDANRAAASRVLSAHLGQNAGRAFDALDPRLQNVLRQHDITPAAWDAIRTEGVRRIGENSYIVPGAITNRDHEMALRRYFADEVQSSVIEADARTQRYMTAGQQRGTAAGEAIRFIMQFKGFPLAFTSRALGRARGGGEGGRNAGAAHIGGLLGGLLVAGYAAMTAKDALRGYGPRDPTEAKTIVAVLLQSGGAGLYGDFLFGQASRTGNSALENLAGPLLSDASRGLSLLARARDGDPSGAEWLNAALSVFPYANVWFARPALDYLVLNDLREALSPGVLTRNDARRRKDFGQDPLVAPSDRMAFDLF